jgi:hydrogenase/urease accessory protein HupE
MALIEELLSGLGHPVAGMDHLAFLPGLGRGQAFVGAMIGAEATPVLEYPVTQLRGV